MNGKFPTNTILVGFLVMVFSVFAFQGTGMATSLNDPYDDTTNSTGVKMASGGITLIYFPVKVAYAGLGGIVGGIVYVLGGGDEESAQAVWTPAIKGTYQITPEHLKGEKPVRFFGQPDSEFVRNIVSDKSRFKA